MASQRSQSESSDHSAGAFCPLRRSQIPAPKRLVRRDDSASAPSAVRTAKSFASPSTSTSGVSPKAGDNRPATNGSTPSQRQRRRHRHNHNPPAAASARPAIGIAGNSLTAPGHAETVLATAITASIPHPIGASANSSRPSGITISTAIPHGMIHNAVIGTASMFAARPYAARRLKW